MKGRDNKKLIGSLETIVEALKTNFWENIKQTWTCPPEQILGELIPAQTCLGKKLKITNPIDNTQKLKKALPDPLVAQKKSLTRTITSITNWVDIYLYHKVKSWIFLQAAAATFLYS